jgi:GNAT superfamily N-acetyltransferase
METRLAESDVVIRPLRADDFPTADVVRRLAFGTMFGLPDPMTFRGDQAPDRTRFLADPAGSFAAEIDGALVGTNFAVRWGSVGLIGPVSVHPDLWNQGIAQRLLPPALEALERAGCRHLGLFTLSHSPKHIALYQKFGFWPRFLTIIMAKPVGPADPRQYWLAYSTLPPSQQSACLAQCRELTDAIYDGLDLGVEIVATHGHGFGETLLLFDGDRLTGFAVCHCGSNTEAGSGGCYVKFGAVRPGPDADVTFARLLAACEGLAAERGLAQLSAGINTARREAYRCRLAAGFRANVIGLAMVRPDEAGYDRPGAYVIDDWR